MSDSQRVLRKVTSRTSSPHITKDEARSLWRAGKIVGLFNIPFENEVLFDACLDFGVENDEPAVASLEHTITSLRALNKKLSENVREKQREISDITAQNLSLLEDNKQSEIARKKAEDSLRSVSKELTRMKEKGRERDMEETEKTSQRERELTERLKEREKEIAHMRTELTKHNTAARDSELVSLTDTVNRYKELISDLVAQNKDVAGRLKECSQERSTALTTLAHLQSLIPVVTTPLSPLSLPLSHSLPTPYQHSTQSVDTSQHSSPSFTHSSHSNLSSSLSLSEYSPSSSFFTTAHTSAIPSTLPSALPAIVSSSSPPPSSSSSPSYAQVLKAPPGFSSASARSSSERTASSSYSTPLSDLPSSLAPFSFFQGSAYDIHPPSLSPSTSTFSQSPHSHYPLAVSPTSLSSSSPPLPSHSVTQTDHINRHLLRSFAQNTSLIDRFRVGEREDNQDDQEWTD